MAAGVCRYCGCTQDDACRLPGGDTCAWMTMLRDRCNAPGCLYAHAAAERKHARELLELRRKATRAPWPSQLRRQRRGRNRQRRSKRRAA